LPKGLGRKIFRGEGSNEKQDRKIIKERKITLLSLFQGGGRQRKKDQKIAKKDIK